MKATMLKRFVLGLALVCCLLGGCAMFSRDQQGTSTTTETTHEVGSRGDQKVDVTTTKKTSTKSESHEETGSPAVDALAGQVGQLASLMANVYAPGSGGVVQSVLHGIGLNTDTAAGMASIGAGLAGWHLHRMGKKKGHAEAVKAKPPVQA